MIQASLTCSDKPGTTGVTDYEVLIQHQSHLTLPGALLKLHYTTSSTIWPRPGFVQGTDYILLCPMPNKDKLLNKSDFVSLRRYVQ